MKLSGYRFTLRKENGELIGRGYELIRQCAAQIPTGPEGEMETFNFSERLQVIQSEDLRAAQAKSFQDRLRRAHTEIKALTPEPGRGRHQYRDEESFKAALAAVIEKYKVAGLLEVEWEVEEQRGRDRSGAGVLTARGARLSSDVTWSRVSNATKRRSSRPDADWVGACN